MCSRNKILAMCIIPLAGVLFIGYQLIQKSDDTPPRLDENQWYMADGNSARNAVGTTSIRNLPDVLWRFTTERCISSYPVVYNGDVYFTDWGGRVYAFDLKTGKEKWRFTNPERPDQIWITPAVDDNHVYAAHVDGLLWALDRNTGKVSWQMRLDDGPSTLGDLTISNGYLYFIVHGQQLVAIDLGKREVAWEHALADEGEHYYAPTTASGKIYATTESHIYVHQNSDQIVMKKTDEYQSSPVINDKFVYVITASELLCLDIEKLTRVWDFAISKPLHLDGIPAISSDSIYVIGVENLNGNVNLVSINKKTHKETWTYTTQLKGVPDPIVSNPVISSDVIYFCIGDIKTGVLYAIDAKTGKELWSFATGPATDAGIALVDDMIVLTVGGPSGKYGNVYVLKKKQAMSEGQRPEEETSKDKQPESENPETEPSE